MTPQEQRKQLVSVAIWGLVTIGLLVAVVLVLGNSQAIFASKATLHTSFANTSGLIEGARVRLAGVDVGIIRAIHFDKDPKNKRIDVDLTIEKKFLDRIRSDSVAQINSKGLLGDMIVDITVGSGDKPALKDGDHLESVEAIGLAQVINSVQGAIGQVDVLVGDVDTRLRDLITPQVTTDFGHLMHSAATIAGGVEHGNGLVHDLIYKPALADTTGQILRDFEHVASRADAAILQIQQILSDAKTGDGLIHAAIYDRKGAEAIDNLQKVTADLANALDEVKNGHGLIHSLIYEKDKTNLLQNLSEVARILRRIAEETDQGKGTLGGLLKDPTVYEDLTTILGNLKRNDLLKALIRYTLVKDNLNRPGRVEAAPAAAPEPAPAPSPAP